MEFLHYQKMVLETVIDPMLSYMELCAEDDVDCGYTEENVVQCKLLMLQYLKALSKLSSPTDEEIMEQVKELILALNDLDESTDYSLIETDEREALCEVIQQSAVECGLSDPSDDITEEWREW